MVPSVVRYEEISESSGQSQDTKGVKKTQGKVTMSNALCSPYLLWIILMLERIWNSIQSLKFSFGNFSLFQFLIETLVRMSVIL